MTSDFVRAGVYRLSEQGIVPIYDGSYWCDETESLHVTWTIVSETKDHQYILDKNLETGQIQCTCPGGLDYRQNCKHKTRLQELA